MALGANSYGSVAEVAALVKVYTASGSFSAAIHPTSTQVEGFIDRISAILNALLAEQGFSIPITQADCKLVLDHFVIEEVADLCEAANRSGRFYSSDDTLRGRGRFRVILSDAKAFIEVHSEGFEALGATRSKTLTYGLGYLSQDDGGDDIEPIFQRKWMGQTVRDWDT